MWNVEMYRLLAADKARQALREMEQEQRIRQATARPRRDLIQRAAAAGTRAQARRSTAAVIRTFVAWLRSRRPLKGTSGSNLRPHAPARPPRTGIIVSGK